MVDNMLLNNKNIGDLGEYLVERYLLKNKYKIVEKNWRRKGGEIDLICKKDYKIYFFEVKSMLKKSEESVDYLPEERVGKKKCRTIKYLVDLYTTEKGIDDIEIDIKVIRVIINLKDKRAKVTMIDVY